MFGAYVGPVGLVAEVLHRHLGISLHDAALYTATFIFPASLLRPLGGWLSDKYGPRIVTYGVFIGMTAALAVLAIPHGNVPGTRLQTDRRERSPP